MATLGRDKDVEIFCKNLSLQLYKSFELIIVDQNTDNRLEKIVNSYKEKFELKYIRSDKKGLSLNRNIGLKYATGEIIAFPDDDCIYKNDTLEFVVRSINDYDFITFNSEDMNPELKKFSFEKNEKIGFNNFFSTGISYTIFIKSHCLANFLFDERLGCGAEFGSGEDSDLMLFLISNKFKGFYFGTYSIYHPYKPMGNNDVSRAYNYARGYGAMYRKCICIYKQKKLLFNFIKAILKNILGILLIYKGKYHFLSFKGKISGFLLYKK